MASTDDDNMGDASNDEGEDMNHDERGNPAGDEDTADGLPAYTSFSDINPDPAKVNALESIYATVDDIDAWLGLIAEAHVPNAAVGPTLVAILKDQFERLRDGDRFWYEAYLDPTTLSVVQNTTLADIILRNTTITTEIQRNVLAFVAPTPPPTPTGTPSPTPTPSPSPTPTQARRRLQRLNAASKRDSKYTLC